MGLGDILKDSFAAALRNPGDSAATRREFRARHNARKTREKLLGQEATILAVVAQKQKEVDTRIANQRAKGHNVQRDVRWAHAKILGGHLALIRYYENDDPTRIDIFYGGAGQPDGPGHGHIVIRNNQMISWETDGNRIKLV